MEEEWRNEKKKERLNLSRLKGPTLERGLETPVGH